MIKVLIPKDSDFCLYEAEIKELYELNQESITDTSSFESIKENMFFYLFLKNDKVFGAIYCFYDDRKLFLNGFSKRKFFSENVCCIKQVCSWFNCDIYAEAQHRASALCLLRAGFKRVSGKLFVFFNCPDAH